MVFDNLTTLGYAVVTLGIVITIGSVVLIKMGEATTTCIAGGDISSNSSDKCVNTTSNTVAAQIDYGKANTTAGYMETQLGSSTGLASWTPAVIALAIGMLFLALFLGKRRL